MAAQFPDSFWSKVNKTAGCWLWTGAKKPSGYGNLTLDKRHCSAHRVSWEMVFGEIPRGMQVCHRCDNPSCVNPEHLFLGSAVDNSRDMFSKGRNRPGRHAGERNWKARLTDEDVRLIRLAAETLPVTHAEIAKAWGLPEATVGGAIRRTSWRHVR